MPTTWEMIDKRLATLKPFYEQVDKTRARLNMTPFKLKTFDGKHYLSDVINVTENKSASYVKRIVAGLMSAKWQTVVDGEISKREAHKIELFIDANLQQADEYILQKYGLAGLDTWLSNHVCHTSLIGVQWMASIDEKTGDYKIHCLPLDMRHTPFVLNQWAAPITFRDKDDLLAELEGFKKYATDDESGNSTFVLQKDTLKDKDNEVRDFWNDEKHELLVNTQSVFSEPNSSEKLPFVFVWTPSGFMFRDKGWLQYESTGLLYLNEQLYDQLSQQLSIDATLSFDPVFPAYQRPTKTLNAVSEPPPQRGESKDLPEGELFELVPRPDINKAQVASRDEISGLVDEAAPISPRSYTSPPSAIEVATEVELLDELQNPRIIALQMFKEQLARLMISQSLTIATGAKAPILVGKTGRQMSFSVADLKDPKKYTVSYQFMKKNKRLAIVNEARAMALWGKAPMKYILRDILAVEDPDGWEREMELEKAKAANPAIGLAEMAVRYAEEAEDVEDEADKALKNWQSMMMVHQYVMMMRQSVQAQSNETQQLREATKETGNSQGLIALTGQAGRGMPARAQKGVTQ